MSYLLTENQELVSTSGMTKSNQTLIKLDTIQGKTTNNVVTVGGLQISNGIANYTKTANVTQGSSGAAVTSNGTSGTITTASLTTASAATNSFTVNNSACLATSFVYLQLISYSGTIYTNGVPLLSVSSVSAGSFAVAILNAGANAFSGSIVFTYKLS